VKTFFIRERTQLGTQEIFATRPSKIPADALIADKGVGKKISRGSMKNQDREIALKSLPLYYQWRGGGRTGHTARVRLKGTLHQESRVNNNAFFWRNTHLRENFRPCLYAKVPTWPQSPLHLHVN